MRRVFYSLAFLLSACAQGGGAASPDAAFEPAPTERFANVAWAQDDPAAAPGSFRIFLADGSLIMDSCYETYRVARWRATGDATFAWTEDTSEISARIENLTDDKMTLVLKLANEEATLSFTRINGEVLCPER
ncbi:MAG: hypothetical protein KDE05_04295 [Parvularculaceae bacterium]|nr:hypothetical protein [Parvularculaceae bacterium]